MARPGFSSPLHAESDASSQSEGVEHHAPAPDRSFTLSGTTSQARSNDVTDQKNL